MASRVARSVAKQQYWREVIDGWRRSGGGVRQWCLPRQISEPSFYSWRRVLAARDSTAANKVSSAAMLPVEIVSPGSRPEPAPLEITLTDGIHLLVRAHCQPALLREALAALQAERRETAAC